MWDGGAYLVWIGVAVAILLLWIALILMKIEEGVEAIRKLLGGDL
jgi:hypothetical protein